MKKLIQGIVDFRHKMQPGHRETFVRLALGQKPDALFICCSDSRVAPNVFASTEPGDLLVMRNVGNMIPPCGDGGISVGDESEVAAIEFALLKLEVSDIIVCGHSECGAMGAIYHHQCNPLAPHLKSWLRHGQRAYEKLTQPGGPGTDLLGHNRLSQLNVLQQVEHLRTYSLVRERIEQGRLRLHGWWFDIAKAEVQAYEDDRKEFIPIDEKVAAAIFMRLDQSPVEA